MEKWIKEDKWKVVFPQEKVFIMKHHNWAFVAWDLARDNGWIKNNATLVHVDQHLDAAIDGATVPGILKAKGLEELSNLTICEYGKNGLVGTDNFIWAGFARETIQSVIYVSPEEDSNLNNTEQQINKLQGYLERKRIKKYTAHPISSMDNFELIMERNMMCPLFDEKSVILDLDLDFFAYKSENTNGDNCYILKEEAEIRRNLRTLKELYNWDIITVALSPEDKHIGGANNASYALKLFLEEFNLDINRGKNWSTLERNTHF